MPVLAKSKQRVVPKVDAYDLWQLIPAELHNLDDPQTAIPKLAKTPSVLKQLEDSISQIPTRHVLHRNDARQMKYLTPNSVHLVLTSPPYWTLK